MRRRGVRRLQSPANQSVVAPSALEQALPRSGPSDDLIPKASVAYMKDFILFFIAADHFRQHTQLVGRAVKGKVQEVERLLLLGGGGVQGEGRSPPAFESEAREPCGFRFDSRLQSLLRLSELLECSFSDGFGTFFTLAGLFFFDGWASWLFTEKLSAVPPRKSCSGNTSQRGSPVARTFILLTLPRP